ncbi:tetratricopeptide repeat protein [Geomonas agri]|uniref:tetratricopeptide repeat protein n=1 Tax=Geomonas agri TaxID=2873702 RepID=UPI001CD26D54|nr:tetratricopeptide repeat protein [Geomonas agri]
MQRLICIMLWCACLLLTGPTLSGAAYFDGMEAYRLGDYKTALREFKASDDDVKSLYMLGVMFEKGHGVKIDFTEAAAWYHKAADKDSAPAQYRLGRLYERGQGVEQNLNEAIKLYKKSSRQGNQDAKLALKRIETP